MTIETEAGQWLTYAEIAAALGKSLPAAQQHVRRRKWPRRPSNHPHDPAAFLVPPEALGEAVGPTVGPTSISVARVETLLGRAWDELLRDLEQSRASIRELQDILANVREDNSRLETRERERQTWGLWLRLAWALRRKP